MSFRVSLFFVLCALCAVHSAPSAISNPSVSQDIFVDPPWLSVLRCFQSDSPTSCIQSRAVRALEDLIPQSPADAEVEADAEDTDVADTDSELEGKLPKGMTPTVTRIIDRIGDYIASGLSQWYPEDPEDLERSGKSVNSVDALDQARGHKKKVKKAIKKAILKLIIVGLLIKQKIKMLLMAAQTFLQFKFLMVAIVYVISNIVKIWIDIKAKHHPQKVIYYENAHHQHHYEPEHHDFDEHEHGGWGGLWGRSIVATEATPPSNTGYNQGIYDKSSNNQYDNYPRSLDRQDIVYHAQKPKTL